MTKFLFCIPQKSLYSEFGFREFQFLKAQSLCALFISTGQLYRVVCCLLCIWATPKVHFIKLEAWFYIIDTLKYDKVFLFYSPKESLFWIWLLRVPIFEGPKSVCPFHQHGSIFLSGVLPVMHFCTLKVHFISLEAWFYVNGTLKYDKVFVFYSPKESLFWIWLSQFQSLKAQSLFSLLISMGKLYRVVFCLLCISAPPNLFH
jgi:hypothetical protein